MNVTRRALAIALLTVSFVHVLWSMLLLPPGEEPLSLLLPAIAGLVTGYVMLKGTLYWPVAGIFTAVAYFSLANDSLARSALRGEFSFIVSAITLPATSTTIPLAAKASYLWFQVVFPLLLFGLIGFCLFACIAHRNWSGRSKT